MIKNIKNFKMGSGVDMMKKALVFALAFVVASQAMAYSLTADDMLAPMFKGESVETGSQEPDNSASEAPAQDLSNQETSQNDSSPANVEVLESGSVEACTAPVQLAEGGCDASAELNAFMENGSGAAIEYALPNIIPDDIVPGNPANGISYTNGETIIVDGNVYTYNTTTGFFVDSEGRSYVTVDGNIINRSNADNVTGVNADRGIVDVQGSVDVSTSTEGMTEKTHGVKAENSSVVVVDNDVRSNDTAITAINSSNVYVGGNVTSTEGIGVITDNTASEVIIDGIVKAAENAFQVNINPNKVNNGVIKAAEADAGTGSAIHLKIDNRCDLDDIDDYLPDIIVGELNANNDKLISYEIVDTNNSTGTPTIIDAQNDTVIQKVYDSIQYLIYVDFNDEKAGRFKLNEGIGVNTEYSAAKEGTEVTVNIVPYEGYSIQDVKSNLDENSFVRVAEGVYKLTVPRGGGVKINAVLAQILQEGDNGGGGTGGGTGGTGNGSGGTGNSGGGNNSGNSGSNCNSNNNNNSNNSSNSTSGNSSSSSSGSSNQNNNSSDLPCNAAAYYEYIKQITNSAASKNIQSNIGKLGQTNNKLVLYLYDDALFSVTDVSNLESINTNLTIVVYYWWHDIEYCVEIPAGYPLKNLLSVDGRCSRLDLASEFGARRTGRTR